jgi:Zn-dependent M28 family amino/carboxypeptidase
VSLRADVEAEFHETTIEVRSSLPGTEEPQKELLIVGHLCHPTPSANDNGSGSGGMLEMARALKRMVETGAIKPPRRTIRFLWVPEFAGTVPYIKAHLDRTRNTLAVINCDMIGENLAKTGGTFNITQTPESLPTYLNDVAVDFARVVEELNRKPERQRQPSGAPCSGNVTSVQRRLSAFPRMFTTVRSITPAWTRWTRSIRRSSGACRLSPWAR